MRIPLAQKGREETTLGSSYGAVTTELVAASELSAWARGRHVLGIVSYEGGALAFRGPHAVVELAQLGHTPLVEAWVSDAPVVHERAGAVSYATNGRVLFGTVSGEAAAGDLLSTTTERAYLAALDVVKSAGYPNLLRMWNYMPGINEEENGMERYKQFSIGRHAAFSRAGVDLQRPPAASALGSSKGGLVIYFLATRDAVEKVENPRQVSAYEYPAQYGPRSPSFSRAAYVRWGEREDLYISGTASIVGHETRHPGDVDSQLDETLENLKLVVRQVHPGLQSGSAPEFGSLKVYQRRARDYPAIRARLEAALGTRTPVLYLRADMCREPLLLEIDAYCSFSQAALPERRREAPDGARGSAAS